jgi:hypothetical protein
MSSSAQTSDPVAVPFTELQMNAIHSALLSEVHHLQGLLEVASDLDYALMAYREAVKLEADFRDFWRNAVTSDALGGE